MLRDITIQNYRCFRHFKLDGLARLNLIVGMNNSGKTSFLEAIYLLVNQGKLQSLFEVLSQRGEFEIAVDQYTPLPQQTIIRRQSYQIAHIFYGRKLGYDTAIHIQSQRDSSISLDIKLIPSKPEDGPLIIPGFGIEETEPELVAFDMSVSYGHDFKVEMPVRSDGTIQPRSSHFRNRSQSDFSLSASPQSFFITISPQSLAQLARLWDRITLTPKEEAVVAALQILEPDVERISFTSHQTSNSGILLKLRGRDNPIPLGSMGDGMRRILNLAMAAVTAENGVLLVDEIDTGLYYQTQTDMWRLLLETAQRLNVQVFATTHSQDCVRAFQEALNESDDTSVGQLLRLQPQGDRIKAVTYTAEELDIAERHNIEVR